MDKVIKKLLRAICIVFLLIILIGLIQLVSAKNLDSKVKEDKIKNKKRSDLFISAQPVYSEKEIKYGFLMNENKTKFSNHDGLKFENASGGYMRLKDKDDQTLRKFGFGITSNEANRSTADYVWNWDYFEDNSTWEASNSTSQFDWSINYSFIQDQDMKIIHYVYNNVKNLTNTKYWYIFTIDDSDNFRYNGKTYYGSIDVHEQGENVSQTSATIKFSNKEKFDFSDTFSEYNVTDFYIGNATMFDFPNQRILALAITKGNGDFNKFQSVTIDPTITLDSTTTYDSLNTNITNEQGFSHLNISDPNLKLYMPFDYPQENASWIAGNYSGALDFDGVDDYISFTNPLGSGVDWNGNNVSLSMWIYANNLERNNVGLFSIGDSPIDGGPEIIFHMDGDSFKTHIDGVYTTIQDLNTNKWYNLIMVLNTFNSTFYIDGSYVKDISNGSVAINGTNMYVGSGYNDYFNGTIDEVRFYNKSLNSSEIDYLYSNNTVISTLNLVSEWKFDDGTGFNVVDSSGSGYHGEILGQRTGTEYDFTNNSNDGTATGGASYTSSGVIGGAYDFDGSDDYISLGSKIDTSTFSGWSAFTWAKYDSSSIGNDYIFGGYALYHNTGNLKHYDGSSVAISTSSFPSETWTHVGVTCDNSTGILTLYFNGTNDSSHSIDCDYSHANRISVVGAYTGTSGNQFQGSLDEVMIFDRALNSTEVSNIYNNQSTRFYPSGTQKFKFEVVGNGNNTINFSIPTYQNYLNSNISTRIKHWDISKGYNFSDIAGSSNNLVAYWTMDYYNSTGIHDNTSINNYGEFKGANFGTSNLTQGVYNYSLDFDGVDDYLDLGNDVSLNLSNALTYSIWFKTSEGSQEYLIYAGEETTGKRRIVSFSSGNIAFNTYGNTLTTSGTYNDDVWHHLVVTSNSTGYAEIYVDGTLDNDGTMTNYNPYDVSVNGVFIGKDDDLIGLEYFNGSLDEVMIYNRSLTASEIQEIYYNGRVLHSTTSYKNYTSGVEHTIDSTTTNVAPEFLYYPSQTNYFYSPIIAGNITLEAFVSASADSTAPNVTIHSPLNITNSSNSMLFNITAIDDTSVSACLFSLDGGTNNQTLSQDGSTDFYNYTNTSMNEGIFTADFWCNDTSNNFNHTSRTFNIDRTSPIITIINPRVDVDENADPVAFTWDTNENSTCNYSLDGGTNTSVTSINGTRFTTTSSVSNGVHTLYVYCTDYFGNKNSTGESVSFYRYHTTGGGSGGSGGISLIGFEEVSNLTNLEVITNKTWFYNENNVVFVRTLDKNGNETEVENIWYNLSKDFFGEKEVFRKGIGKYEFHFYLQGENKTGFNLNITTIDKNKEIIEELDLKIREKNRLDEVKENAKSNLSGFEEFFRNNWFYITLIILVVIIAGVLITIMNKNSK